MTADGRPEAEVQVLWVKLITELASQGVPMDVNALVRESLRPLCEKISANLRPHLEGVGGLFGGAAGGGAAGGSMVSEMAAMNMQFMALQNAVQMESRKFQTLSNASKARHDIAMASIRNTKA